MGPLQGIRVLELSTGIAGPIAGMLLGDYGADVVKIEPTGGDPARSQPGFAVWNRNKRSAVTSRDLRELIAGADICIAGDTLPELKAADLPPASLVEEHPRLVFLHVPPYIPAATPWASGRESAELLSAMGGPASRQSSFDGGPVDLVYPFVLYMQGQWAAACAVAALVERERSGCGQVVTVAGIHGVMTANTQSFVVDPSQPPLATNVGPGGRNPTYTTYKCGDGQWLFLAALTPKFQANAFKVVGIDIFGDERIGGSPANMLLPENRAWIRQALIEAFASRPRDEWLQRLEEGDCPAGPLQQRDGWLDHPQVVANDLRAEVDDAERGRVVMPGLSLQFSKTPGAIRSAAPRLGTEKLEASDWKTDAGPGRATPGARPVTPVGSGPLAGVRVLDMGTILAGPYAGMLLSELGADVVKVESPAGDAFRETGFVYNRGMRGLAVDLSRPEGQTAFHQLAAQVDVVIDNSRQGVLHRLRADYATLAEINPGIITLSVAGFGERGPLAHKPAFDPVLQAMSGMMSAQGGDSDPVLFTIPINDVAAAATSVLGVCLGLYHRARSGEGQRIVTSLAATSLMMQSGQIVRFQGRPPAVRGGRDFAGPSEGDRFYQCVDGWIRIQTPAAPEEGRITTLLDDVSRMRVEQALSALDQAGISAVPARQPAAVAADPALRALDVFCEQSFADGRPFLAPNRYARFSRTESHASLRPPGIGEHSRQILIEAGLPAAEIEALIAAGTVRQGEPMVLRGLINYR